MTIDRDPIRRTKLSNELARMSPHCFQPPVGRKFLDTIIPRVGNVHVSLAVDGQRLRLAQFAARTAEPTPGAKDMPGSGKAHDATPSLVQHVEGPAGGN